MKQVTYLSYLIVFAFCTTLPINALAADPKDQGRDPIALLNIDKEEAACHQKVLIKVTGINYGEDGFAYHYDTNCDGIVDEIVYKDKNNKVIKIISYGYLSSIFDDDPSRTP